MSFRNFKLCFSTAFTLALIFSFSSVYAQQQQQQQRWNSLQYNQASFLIRDMARKHHIPNVNYGTAQKLMQQFPHLRQSGFRHDACFALDPKSTNAKQFYQELNRYAQAHNLAVVGLGIVEEFNHPFCFAPVTRDNLNGQVMQMDATDPTMGSFSHGKKTRVKPAFGEKMFLNQARAFWLIPREPAIIAGNAKYDVVKAEVQHGVNCAEFSTGLLHHLKELGVSEFSNFYAANRAVVNATGPKNHRGFAAGLILAKPHIIIQHTNPEWQTWATDPRNGAYQATWNDHGHQVSNLITCPINMNIKYQDFEM